MKKPCLVIVVAFCWALVAAVAGCGEEATTTTAVSATTALAPATAATEGAPTWTQLEPVGNVPSPRGDHSLVYDPGIGAVILFGGYDGTSFLNDTWAYDPVANTWTELNPSGVAPSATTKASLVYDPGTGKVIAYEEGIWAYDSVTNAWTELHPVGDQPPARGGSSMTYDPASGKVIMFGGQTDTDDTCYNDTWAYDSATNTWANLNPAGSLPDERWGAAMVYDEASGKMILCGGLSAEATPSPTPGPTIPPPTRGSILSRSAWCQPMATETSRSTTRASAR